MSRVNIDRSALEKFLNDPDGPVGAVLRKTAVQVEASAKRKAPVDTGRLRASMKHGIERDASGVYAVVGSDVEYAIYVELGTRNMNAQPYLRPALAEVVGR